MADKAGHVASRRARGRLAVPNRRLTQLHILRMATDFKVRLRHWHL